MTEPILVENKDRFGVFIKKQKLVFGLLKKLIWLQIW